MKVIVDNFTSDIFPTDGEVEKLCKPGTDDCCVWLTMGTEGWQCVNKNRPSSLNARFEAGETNAKRDGCKEVNEMVVMGIGLGEHQFFIPKN